MLYAILAAVLVALDQLVKYLVVQNIPLGEHVPFLPYLLDLTYVQNTGAAFSLFSDHTWILALISLVMSVLLALAVWKPLFRHPFGRTALALLLAGAVGNLIDRALQGYVVDMFHVLFHPGGGGRAAGRLSGPQRGGAHPLRRPAAAGGGGGDQRRPSPEKERKDRPRTGR